MKAPRNGSSSASIWCWPGSRVPTTWPWFRNRASSSASTMARLKRRRLLSGHLKTIWPLRSSGTAMNSRLNSGIASFRFDEDLGVEVGMAQLLERVGDPVQVHHTRYQRRDVHGAVGNHLERPVELGRLVAEHELEGQLLGDGEEGLEGVRLHADAHHHDPRLPGRVAHGGVDHAGHA